MSSSNVYKVPKTEEEFWAEAGKRIKSVRRSDDGTR